MFNSDFVLANQIVSTFDIIIYECIFLYIFNFWFHSQVISILCLECIFGYRLILAVSVFFWIQVYLDHHHDIEYHFYSSTMHLFWCISCRIYFNISVFRTFLPHYILLFVWYIESILLFVHKLLAFCAYLQPLKLVLECFWIKWSLQNRIVYVVLLFIDFISQFRVYFYILLLDFHQIISSSSCRSLCQIKWFCLFSL